MQTFWSTQTLRGSKSGPNSGKCPKIEVGMESLWWILKILNLLGQQLVRAPSCAVDRVGWDLVLQPAH